MLFYGDFLAGGTRSFVSVGEIKNSIIVNYAYPVNIIGDKSGEWLGNANL